MDWSNKSIEIGIVPQGSSACIMCVAGKTFIIPTNIYIRTTSLPSTMIPWIYVFEQTIIGVHKQSLQI